MGGGGGDFLASADPYAPGGGSDFLAEGGSSRISVEAFQGPHCLRHVYAVHLLRCGTTPKTIGDLLGHRSVESTCVYLRLAIEDLREVPLDLPTEVPL